MSLIIVEYLPYLAFAAAAVLMAWVGVDVLRGRRAKKVPGPAKDSGRGLAGPVMPLAEIPVSQAHVPPEPEVLAPQAEVSLEDAPEPAPMTEESSRVAGQEILVKRDPSVRVFDTAVAPSGRV